MALALQMRGKRIPQMQRTVGVHLPAPVGGINAASALTAMPVSDCIALWNLIPFQYGLRVRSGYREWIGVLTVGGPISPLVAPLPLPLSGTPLVPFNGLPILTLLSFTGSQSNGNADRLFACTAEGIWDVTSSGSTSTLVYTFPLSDANSGKGVSTAFANTAGLHYLAYCDGSNGYLLYSETTDTWSQVVSGIGAGEINGADPTTFRFVMSWKNRLWFVPDNSQKAYYLPIGQFAGDANPIYFGARFRYGGNLVGLYSWTIDGGEGIDDKLVGISRSGDVVVYEGIDPSIPGAFGLKGVYWVGPVPPGRHIASDFGGDLFILSLVGCVPLSKLVSGGLIRDPSIYATQKIANLFNVLMTERGNLEGWEIRIHPTDNLLIINVPVLSGSVREQLTMSLATQGWSRHRGVPMNCLETWRGKLYFGTTDSRVCVNDGYADNVALSGAAPTAIDWAILTAYQNMGSASKKRLHMVKPMFITDGTVPAYTAAARWDFDLSELNPAPTAGAATAGSWDNGNWDVAVWANSVTSSKYNGTTGMGTAAAVMLRGTSITNTTLIGFDVQVESGGLL